MLIRFRAFLLLKKEYNKIINNLNGMEKIIPVEVSARHIHLCQNDLEKLFGKGFLLKKLRQLSQPSDFATEEVLDIEYQGKLIKQVRVVGPVREKTQVEISKTDAIFLGANPPLRLSGDVEGSAEITLISQKTRVELKEGLIIAQRHLHCATEEAIDFGLKTGDTVCVKVEGERAITFFNVAVRIKDDYKLCLHLDTDEGNAANINKCGQGTITKK